MPKSKEVTFDAVVNAANARIAFSSASRPGVVSIDDSALRSALGKFAKARSDALIGLSADAVRGAIDRLHKYVPFINGLMEQLPEFGIQEPSVPASSSKKPPSNEHDARNSVYSLPPRTVKFYWNTVVSERYREQEALISPSCQLEALMVLFSLGLATRKQAHFQLDSLELGAAGHAKVKEICATLCTASGIFEYVAGVLLPRFDVDGWPKHWHTAPELRAELYRFLSLLSLAEAQALCCWRAIHKPGTTPTVAARLTSGAFTLFDEASRLHETFKETEEPQWRAVQNYALNSATVFRGLSLQILGEADYREANEGGGATMGNAVARLKAAQRALSTHSVWHSVGKSPYWNDCAEAEQECARVLKKASEENDLVYFQNVTQEEFPLPEPFIIAKTHDYTPPEAQKLPMPQLRTQEAGQVTNHMCSLM